MFLRSRVQERGGIKRSVHQRKAESLGRAREGEEERGRAIERERELLKDSLCSRSLPGAGSL